MRALSLIAVVTAASFFAPGCTPKEASPGQQNPTTTTPQISAAVPATVVDPAPFRPRADAARSKAIDHYRAALAGLPNGPERRLAWADAVKLVLGRSEQPEHICFYD